MKLIDTWVDNLYPAPHFVLNACLNLLDTSLNFLDTCLNLFKAGLNLLDTCLNLLDKLGQVVAREFDYFPVSFKLQPWVSNKMEPQKCV